MSSETTPCSLTDPVRAGALLVAMQRRDDGALEELIAVCTPVVRAHARRFAWQTNDVDDIVQEVWLRVILKADQIREPAALLGWLRVVTSRVASELGHAGRRLVPTSDIDETAASGAVEEDVVESRYRADGVRRVRIAVAELRPEERVLLLLLHRERRPSYQAISDEVRRPIGSLGPTRNRLLGKLRRNRHLAGFALSAAS